jgi:prevent-host-death family protein
MQRQDTPTATSLGVFDAKARLSALIDRAAAGEEIVITRHGRPVAKLVRATAGSRETSRTAAQRLLKARAGVTLDGLPWKALRDEGRR